MEFVTLPIEGFDRNHGAEINVVDDMKIKRLIAEQIGPKAAASPSAPGAAPSSAGSPAPGPPLPRPVPDEQRNPRHRWRRRPVRGLKPLTTAGARRRTEALLLVLVVVIAVSGHASAGLAMNDALPPNLTGFTISMSLLALVGHLAVRRFAAYADPLIFPLAMLLTGLGLVLLHRLDQGYIERYKSTANAPGQLLWSVVGVAACILVLWVLRDHRLLQRFIYITMAVALVALIAPAVLRRGHLRGEALDPARRALGPARRVREDHDRRLLRGLPGHPPRRAGPVGPQVPGHAPAPDAPARTDRHGVDHLAARAGLRARPRYLADLLRRLRGDALRGHGAHQLDRLRSAHGLGGRLRRGLHGTARQGPRGRLAEPAVVLLEGPAAGGHLRPVGAGAVQLRHRRHLGHGARHGQSGADQVHAAAATSSSPRSARNWAWPVSWPS